MSLVVGGLGLLTVVLLATPNSGPWVFLAWLLVIGATAAVGAGLAMTARGHAATVGSLQHTAGRRPWPEPDPDLAWPGPRLLGGDVFELGKSAQPE